MDYTTFSAFALKKKTFFSKQRNRANQFKLKNTKKQPKQDKIEYKELMYIFNILNIHDPNVYN